MIDDVTAHVAQCAGAEIAPAAPICRHVGRAVRSLVNRAEPQIPIQCRRHRRRIGRAADALLPQPAGAIGPHMNFAHFTDQAGLDPFVREARSFAGVALIAHLRGDARRMRGLGQFAALVQRVRQRLLTINVLAGANGRHRCDGMNMIRRADGDGVDVLCLFVDELAKILVAAGLRKGLKAAGAGWSSTSHSATMLAPLRAWVAMSPPPIPPAPIPARFTRSLGGTKPAPPSTCRGTIVKPSASPPEAARNFRRVAREVRGERSFLLSSEDSGMAVSFTAG